MRKVLLAFVLLVLAAAAVTGWQYTSLVSWSESRHAPGAEVVVEITPGTGPKTVANKLAAAGAVTDADRFYYYVRLLRRASGALKAGEYAFRPEAPQSPAEVLERLLKGEVLSIKVTIPEGLRLDEQAPIFAAAGLGDPDEYVRLARDPEFARSLGVDAGTLEGYLYPDTYLVPRTMDTKGILRMMVSHFFRAWERAESQRDPAVGLNRHEATTLASIVEKETGLAEERRRISCVFHNRLRKDMKLQTDPTVIYSVLLSQGAFDGNLRRIHLDTPHPYNTYSVKGLPPGPIANAGYEALAAALNPIECNDLFFVSRNDGSHVFCPDYACHQRNVQVWQIEYFRNKRAMERRR